jgi:hypothetical protein
MTGPSSSCRQKKLKAAAVVFAAGGAVCEVMAAGRILTARPISGLGLAAIGAVSFLAAGAAAAAAAGEKRRECAHQCMHPRRG